MSMTVTYQRISSAKFTELQNNPEVVKEFFIVRDSSIIGQFKMIKETLFQDNSELLKKWDRDEASVYDPYLDTAKSRLCIEKEWQAIHYLLTGKIVLDESQAKPLLSTLVIGGTPTKFKASYGYIRYFSSNEVKELAQALHQISKEDLRINFDARGHTKIYAQGDEWDENAWYSLSASLDIIACFFQEAATNSEVILIS